MDATTKALPVIFGLTPHRPAEAEDGRRATGQSFTRESSKGPGEFRLFSQSQISSQESVKFMARQVGLHQGAFDAAAAQDAFDTDALSGPITQLSGSADAINPSVAGNYLVTTAGVDAMTLKAPRVGTDDNLQIAVYSDTTNAHTITATSLFANGTALKTTATFAAFRGAGLILRAWNGVWQVIAQTGITFS